MIIEFRDYGRDRSNTKTKETTSAQIIIFPGVMRERHIELQKTRRRQKVRPKRGRLELPD